jgi:hypothetical protein
MENRVMALKQVGVVALLCVSLLAGAQTVYQGKDASGNPVFTDQPRPGDKPVELQAPNTIPAAIATPRAPREAAFTGYTVALSAAGSVPNEHVPVPVSITIEPALRPGHAWNLLLDGAVAVQGFETAYTFESLSRGRHTLSLQVVDESGAVIGEAEPVSVYVQFQGGAENKPRTKPVHHAPR